VGLLDDKAKIPAISRRAQQRAGHASAATAFERAAALTLDRSPLPRPHRPPGTPARPSGPAR
jgi:hypothetical protein